MNQYTDLQIIECNRLHSEEAKSKNNENFALWQNNLQDIVHLNAGDKVSVHGAMISERGAGQSSSIEIKGETLGFTKTYEFTTIDEKNASESLPTKYEIIECNASSKTIEIKDDTLNFTTSYYVTMNGHNYIHLPRRWWFKKSTLLREQWSKADDLGAGLTYYKPFKDQFAFFDDYYQIIPTQADHTTSTKNFKAKNNNDRYTLLLRDKSYYSASSASGNLPDQYVRDPENAIYRTHKELKSFSIPAGFNSPEYVAEELTRQFQNIIEEREYEFKAGTDTSNASVPGWEISPYRTISTETYKPFNVAYMYDFDSTSNLKEIEEDFGYYYNASGSVNNASGYQWLSQYHCVATKRPELYEKGRLVNFIEVTSGNRDYRGIFGATQSTVWRSTDNEIEIFQQYNRETCEFWRDFFLAQELYPEIWNAFSDPRSDYDPNDTINNSRWIHINRYANASQSYNGSRAMYGNAMLGDSGYDLHSWNSPGNVLQVGSALMPIFYKARDRDIFYENPEPDQYSFGCLRPNKDNNRILITATPNNGGGSAFYNMLAKGGLVDERRLGFDMHFSAPGMSYVLPYAGWMHDMNSYAVNTTGVADLANGYYVTAGGGAQQVGEHQIEATRYKNKLYIGADSPKVQFDGTHFSLSDLHTGLNAGNFNIAKNPYTSLEPEFGSNDIDAEADRQIYIINPKEQWNDWTPTRKPYRFSAESASTPNPTVEILNDNLEPWTIYDSLCGIFIDDINLTQNEWIGTLWDILGFSYKQFNSTNHTRITRIDNNNVKELSLITTNAEVNQGDTKVYIQNNWGSAMFNNMIGGGGTIYKSDQDVNTLAVYFPEIKQKTESIKITADNLPTRMIRGYYTIRSNILQETPFIGGKINNTTMPIIGIVDKINGDGDFYFGQESSLEFTITKPLRLASITCSVHDPDGSYARCSNQSAVLFKIQRPKQVTFNIAEELLQEAEKNKK
jgi:hypothetical protein